MNTFLLLAALAINANGYWLMGIQDFITTERLDPIVNPGKVSGHVHSILGGSNFRMNTNTASLRQSECTSVPIPQDKSNYWFPLTRPFTIINYRWENGSFTSLDGGAVMYVFIFIHINYLFDDKPGTTTAFPDDFRMLSGDPTLRTYDPNSYAQQAVTFLCLDFDGTSTRYNSLPAKECPSGIRAQINFPSCWDGKNLDSADHKSHVAFLSGGPDRGTCSDPKYPVTIPRLFFEVYWASNSFASVRSQAKNSTQPFVYSYGDPTGYGYHADFVNGWEKGVLQNAVDKCHCNPYGDPTCCVDQGIFNMDKGKHCRITKSVDEPTTGTLPKLPGNNPVQREGVRATMFTDANTPALLSPVYAYTDDTPPAIGKPIFPIPSSNASSSTGSANPTTGSTLYSTSSASSSTPLPQFDSSFNIPPSHTLNLVNAEPHTASDSSSHSLSSLPLPASTVVLGAENGNGAAGNSLPSHGSSPASTNCKSRHGQLLRSNRHARASRRLMKPHGWAS
ncbi:hypothetical protein L208DRAFT_1410716 [Tricholoma matsutake]|nr:hypothetical protein L208DRAFT_1410716 [Tricholoma matsutake 945]